MSQVIISTLGIEKLVLGKASHAILISFSKMSVFKISFYSTNSPPVL